MKLRHVLLGLVVLAFAVAGYCWIFPHKDTERTAGQKQVYICPMHPQIVRDAPGDCPICGMALVLQKVDEPKAKRQVSGQGKTMYRSTMNPGEISDKPGKDSMGMEMVPFTPEEEQIAMPEGLAAVRITREKRELLGVAFSPVLPRRIKHETRTSARIVPDETRQYQITAKVEGWADRLFINQTGQFVKKAAPLLAVYSPELVSAEQEFISALAGNVNTFTPVDSARSAGLSAVAAAAREKLRLFDISEEQIERLQRSRKVEHTMVLHAPISGYVMEKMVLQGDRIMMNAPLMTIADLSHVWGEADIYESDLPYIKVGMPAELTLSYWPGTSFQGHISFLNPFLDPATRTVKARIELDNPGLKLKPGMYADIRLDYDLGEHLSIPESAVMHTGARDYAFVQGPDDLIIPRAITTGAYSSDGFYQLLSGVTSGELVLTSANFLVDSESSLKAALNSANSAAAHQHKE
ncbi:MAG TPA: efflux RND transporter periplasmic adaptor subunit [bacterium]|nr:efflux RND transporter periplasmic adaptor subunit [bacterium]